VHGINMSGKKGKGKGAATIFTLVEDGAIEQVKEMLIADPALVKAVNKDGWTPLMQSAYAGQAEIMAVLLAAGSDVNARCHDGDTAMHYASAQGEAECIEALATAGAKLDVEDNDGETPIAVAQGKKIKNLLQSLIDKREAEGGDEDDDDGDDEEDAT
jgi:ankyrin repeat protein